MQTKRDYTIFVILVLSTIFFLVNPHLMAETDPATDTVLVAEIVEDPPLLINFSLNGSICDIRKKNNPEKNNFFEIIAVFPYEIELENLIAEFETRKNTVVLVKEIQQVSGITANDFSVPVTYLLKRNDEYVQEYTVRIVFKPEFRLDLGVNIHPSYNTTYGMVNIGFDGDLFIGGKFTDYLIGLEASDNYYIFNGQSGGNNISGYWNILRGAFANRILLSRYLGLKWGIGGSWMNSVFKYNNVIRYTRNNPGIFMQFDLNYSPWKYIRFDVTNQFDLFMNAENGNPFEGFENFYPYYKGGIQVTFLNSFKWLRLHFGLSGLYSYYKKDNINTTTAMLIFDTGLHFDLQFPSLLKKSMPDNNNNDKKIAGIGIGTLKVAKRNDMVEFPDIEFKKDSNDLTEESLIVLSDITDVLAERNGMEISIILYSIKGDDPISILSMSASKLRIIKTTLINMGVEESRIHIPNEVSFLDEKSSEKSILIKILVLKTIKA